MVYDGIFGNILNVENDKGTTLQMSSDEMKVLKFKTIINDTYKKLGENTRYIGSYGIHPVKRLLNVEKENPFINCIVNLSAGNTCGVLSHSDIEGVIEAARICSSRCSWEIGCSVPAQTIFFALIALAIDNDLYNEKIDIVSDAAYLMGFTEDMMEDWVTAVRKVLLAEKINSDEMKSEEARCFFGHLE